MARKRSASVVINEGTATKISTVEAAKKSGGAMADPKEEGDDEETAKPIGEVVTITGTGTERRKHYRSFEYRNDIARVFEIGMTILLIPESVDEKPYFATIKEISEDTNGRLWVMVQWFYRPGDALNVGGGHWEERVSNELFYSFHYDEVPAESVMHECVIHFVPLHKKPPSRKQHPGMVVQRVYDFRHKKLLNLTGGDLEEDKQRDIDLLVERTRQRLGELPDVVTEHSSPQKKTDQLPASHKSLTANERSPTEPEKTDQIRMTGNPCRICLQKKVGVADIILTGRKVERYQLLCTDCGNWWYSSQDAIIL